MYKCTVCTAWLTERDDLAVFLAANTGVAINSFEPAATNRMTYLSSDPHLDGWVEIKGIIISLGNRQQSTIPNKPTVIQPTIIPFVLFMLIRLLMCVYI